MRRMPLLVVVGAMFAVASLCGCQKPKTEKPDYNRPLPPGQHALRLLLDPAAWPDLQEAYRTRHDGLNQAIDRSIVWFNSPSTKNFFPLGDVTHLRGHVSAFAFKEILNESASAIDFDQRIRDQFNCYTSVGYDDRGSVLYTGYYTPVYKGSLTRTETFKYPLYKRPADLVIEELTGEVKGRKVGESIVPFPARAEIESSNMMQGLELVYVASRLDQYVIQVNGSAKIDLPDGRSMYIGYHGNNGHEYTGLGQMLVKDGVLEAASLPEIRRYFAANPDKLEGYIQRNARYVFFKEYTGDNWPAGSLGFKVTDRCSLATDKSVFPRGSVVIARTAIPTLGGGAPAPSTLIMVDQDTGGAIRAAGRADIYYGIGPSAEEYAGRQFAEGKLFYFFLKHEHVLDWHSRMKGGTPTPPAPPGATDASAP